MPRIRALVLGLIILFVFAFFTASASFGANTIKIGVVGSMLFDNGQEMWKGALMAAEEINKRGGVRIGQQLKKIQLIRADTNEFLNIDYATNTMEMLLMNTNVDFVVGGVGNEATLVMQDVAMDYKKIFISIGATTPELCQRVAQHYSRYKYFFRNGIFNSEQVGKACLLQLDFVAQNLKKALGLTKMKVAIIAEKADWTDDVIALVKQSFPRLGLEIVGTFHPSGINPDHTAEIEAVMATKAPIVFTLFFSQLGTTFVTQAADLGLTAMQVGVNVDAQKGNFWETTDGKAEYLVTTTAFCRDVEMTKLTKPFLEGYLQRFGTIPSYTAATYTAIVHTLVPAIEQAGNLDSEMLVKIIENRSYDTIHGRYAYEKDELGRHLHDMKFGAEYAMPLGGQWQDGELKGIWPNNYQEKPGMAPLTYKGIVDLKIPPAVINEFK
jgi:branched-chain amino acid transport system substrate-binding protein